MEDNERRNHSNFVVGDDESMSEGEGAEPAAALFARQQMGLSRPQSVAMPEDVEPTSEEEAMADEAMEAAQAPVAAGTFDDLQGIIATPEIEKMLDPNNSQN